MARKLGSSDDTNVVALNPGADERRQTMGNVSQSTFLECVRENAKINAELKAVGKRRKEIRAKWKLEGIELGLLDATLKMAEWDRGDVRGHFETGRRYAEWLGLPIGQQADLFKTAGDDAVLKAEWFGLGRVASRLGKPGKAPDECPPEYQQAFMAGFNEEDEAEWLAAETSDAVQAAGEAKFKPGEPGTVSEVAEVLAAKPARSSRTKPGAIDPQDDRDPEDASGSEGDSPKVLN